MSLSNEWEDEHLTPSGWVSGSCKHDFGREERPVPLDAVLTVRKHVVVGAIGALPHVDVSETNLTDDIGLIASLRKTFGEPKFGC
ncbi:hypothetical protein ABE583_02715 [Stenotrophomonas sp. TWI143]|uniref:hypothetical protein n=1 Tax=Stenotrophomonas sp. TWI143 TaxID=3136771 RepID=UPI00320AB31B